MYILTEIFLVPSTITHEQMQQTYLLFKLCFNNSH
jgi:hypothetical protein